MKKKADEAFRRYFLFVLVLFVIVSVFLIADLSQNNLTGALTSSTTTASITINAAPVVSNISIIGNSSPLSITESGRREVRLAFIAVDADGFGQLDNNSAALQINITKYLADGTTLSTVRSNYSCIANNTINDNAAINYSCVVHLWYFDAGGTWTINASIKDTNGVHSENRTTQFLLATTTAMIMSPTALTWPSLELSGVNQTSNNDPITINNTGNKDIAAGGITVTGYDLQGLTTLTERIFAQNFSVHAINGTSGCTGINCLECNGTQLLNDTTGSTNPQTLAMANMTAGNNSINFANETSGQENIFFCLRVVPPELSRQSYDTSGTHTSPWTITVS